MGRGILAGVLLCLLATPGGADVVRLENGSSFRGKILRENSRVVVIQTKYGKITFRRSRVARIVRDRPREGPSLPAGRDAVRPPREAFRASPSKEARGEAGKERGWRSPVTFRGRRDPRAVKLLERLAGKDWESLPDLRKLGPAGAAAVPELLRLLGRGISIYMKDRGSCILYSVNKGPFTKPVEKKYLPREAALTLAAMGRASIRPLLLVLGDSNPLRRKWALAALGWNGSARGAGDVAAGVAVLLEDPDKGVREEAVRTLGFLGARFYRRRIAPYLLDPEESIRWRSIEALKRLVRGPELDPLPLLKALQTRTEWKRKAARAALEELKGRFREGRRTGEELARADRLASPSKLPVRERIYRLKRDVRGGGAGARSALARALRDPSGQVRAAAARLLGKADYPGKEKILERALRDPDRLVRMAAAGSLGMIGGIDAFPVLFRAYAQGRIGDMILGLVRSLNRKDPGRIEWELARRAKGGPGRDRKAAVYLLGFVTTPGSRDALGRAAGWDRDPSVRRAALESLVRLGKEESLPCLVKALRDRNPSLRKLAYKRLKWIARIDLGPGPVPWEAWLRRR